MIHPQAYTNGVFDCVYNNSHLLKRGSIFILLHAPDKKCCIFVKSDKDQAFMDKQNYPQINAQIKCYDAQNEFVKMLLLLQIATFNMILC